MRFCNSAQRLDIAFNNAGSGHMPAPLAELSVQDFDDAIGVNLRGILVAMKFELAAMLTNGSGSIVNMSSTAGVQGVRGMSAYSATKHAIIGATKSAALLAEEVASAVVWLASDAAAFVTGAVVPIDRGRTAAA